MQKFELVLAEEYKFEYWEKRLKIGLFGSFGLSRLGCKQHQMTILLSKMSLKVDSFGCRPWWKRWSLQFWWKMGFNIEKREKVKRFLMEFSDYLDSDEREKNNDFSTEYSCTAAVFPIEILAEEIEFVVAEKETFEVRSILKQLALFWKIWTVMILLHVSKEKILTELSSTKEKFRIETLVGGIIPVVTDTIEFDYRKKSKRFNTF